MSATLDANILVYASNDRELAHARAQQLLEELASGPEVLYVFWPTVMGYLRLVTHPGILHKPMRPADARENIGALLALPHVRAPGEGPGFWEKFLETAPTTIRGNDIPDAHLATLMRQYDVRVLYTRDRGFRRFPFIDVHDPFE